TSSHPPSGVRTPTDIMRQRREREGRRKAEQEARDREQEDAEYRLLHQEQQPSVQAQPAYVPGVDRTSQGRPTTSVGRHNRQGSRDARPGSMSGQPGPPPSSGQPNPGSQQHQKPAIAQRPQQQQRHP